MAKHHRNVRRTMGKSFSTVQRLSKCPRNVPCTVPALATKTDVTSNFYKTTLMECVRTITQCGMSRTSLKDTLNIGIMAHIDAGKTTTTERILYCMGKSHKIGEVHDGTATMDWVVQEQPRGTGKTTTARLLAKALLCNQAPTANPDHFDFAAEVERSLHVLDGTVAVFCAVGGVQPLPETVWHQAHRYSASHVAFANKMGCIICSIVATRLKVTINSVGAESATNLKGHPMLPTKSMSHFKLIAEGAFMTKVTPHLNKRDLTLLVVALSSGEQSKWHWLPGETKNNYRLLASHCGSAKIALVTMAESEGAGLFSKHEQKRTCIEYLVLYETMSSVIFFSKVQLTNSSVRKEQGMTFLTSKAKSLIAEEVKQWAA